MLFSGSHVIVQSAHRAACDPRVRRLAPACVRLHRRCGPTAIGVVLHERGYELAQLEVSGHRRELLVSTETRFVLQYVRTAKHQNGHVLQSRITVA